VAAAKKRRPNASNEPARQPPQRKRFDFTNRKFLIAVAVVAVVLVAAFFGTALATDRSVFCKTCHSMVPFYDAWTVGPHAQHATCIDCHVNAGYPARFAHKFVALREVYDQFFGNSKFPNYNADLPDRRCLRCHPDAPTRVVGQFQHAQHIARGVSCAKCHATTGHKVMFSTLASAGLLNTFNAPADKQFVGQEFQGLTGKGSVYPGHRPVPCQNCHDQANLECSFCHTPPPNHFGANCRLCHSNAAVPFSQFTHPPSGEHDWRRRPCVQCHPNGYNTVYCTCHKGNPPKGD
jgi:nitrate/TMAO reductase-like tetraheme cytochrome c subunit